MVHPFGWTEPTVWFTVQAEGDQFELVWTIMNHYINIIGSEMKFYYFTLILTIPWPSPSPSPPHLHPLTLTGLTPSSWAFQYTPSPSQTSPPHLGPFNNNLCYYVQYVGPRKNEGASWAWHCWGECQGLGVRVMEVRNSGVRVSLCQGLGARVMEVRNLGWGCQGLWLRIIEVRNLWWGQDEGCRSQGLGLLGWGPWGLYKLETWGECYGIRVSLCQWKTFMWWDTKGL
jgi:hypothetical protein